MLTLSLRSGVGLGSFTLGCRINEALIIAKQNRSVFGCVELKFFAQASHKQDLILSFPEHGLHMIFSGTSQRLRLIEVFDLSRMQVKQGGTTIGGSAHPATFEAVYDLAGPTYPGRVDSKHAVFVMHWPGLLILFPLSAQSAASWQDMQQGRALPAPLPNGTAPVACRICIHASKAVSLDELAQSRPLSAEASPEQYLGVTVGRGLALQDTQQELCLGDTPQDAWSALGAPSGTFTKRNTSSSHQNFATPSLQQHLDAGSADYFYNYFDRGLDLLFCGVTHRLKKIVLHSNLPDHVSFGTYNKCHFLIRPPSSPTCKAAPETTSDSSSCEMSEVAGSSVTCQQAQHQQQAQHAQQAQRVQQSQPTQRAEHAQHQQQAQQEQHRQFGPQSEDTHDGQSQMEGDCNNWRQQGQLPVAKWLSQADDAGGYAPGLHGDAPGDMAGLAGDALRSVPANVQQTLLDDIMAMTRADSEAGSSDSSQTQQRDLPGDVNADSSSNQAQSAPASHVSPSLRDEESAAQHESLQDHVGAHHQGCLVLQAASVPGLGQSTTAPSVNDGWDRGRQGGSEDGPAGGSNMDGWDDMNPMALLSRSVQSQARAQDIDSADPAQPVTPLVSAPQATQQCLPDEPLSAAHDTHHHQTKLYANSVQSPRAPSVNVDRPDPSKSRSKCTSSGCGHHSKEADMKKHLDGHEEGNELTLTSEAAPSEKDGAALKDAHHSSRSPSLGFDSNQQGATASALDKGDAQQEPADEDASGAVPSSLNCCVPMEAAVLTAESSLADVHSMLGQGDRAVIHTRAPGRDAFGPMLVYGYPGVVFETTQAGRIASVTIF